MIKRIKIYFRITLFIILSLPLSLSGWKPFSPSKSLLEGKTVFIDGWWLALVRAFWHSPRNAALAHLNIGYEEWGD